MTVICTVTLAGQESLHVLLAGAEATANDNSSAVAAPAPATANSYYGSQAAANHSAYGNGHAAPPTQTSAASYSPMYQASSCAHMLLPLDCTTQVHLR